MARLVLIGALCAIVFSSCVPTKKLLYLQKDDEVKERDHIVTDTVLRTHELSIKEYRIQPLDLLNIRFETLSEENDAFDFLQKLNPQGNAGGGGGAGGANAQLNGILVNGDGDIEYPVLGKIKVAGLTLFQAEDAVRSRAAQYVPDVVARVRMLNFRFTILGEVNSEQTVVSNNVRLTMMEAIGLAGGLGELADRSKVKVLRQNGASLDVYYLNLLEEEFVESQKFYVQQNDVIVVMPLKQRTFRRYWVGNLGIITATLSFAAIIIALFK